jgi:hypothetical protein
MPITETRAGATLEHLVRHTLEVLCFAEAQRLSAVLPIARPVAARIDFSGARAGHLQLEAEDAAARALTAAFLGLEPWHPSLASYTHDAMRELARVLSGRLVTSLDPEAPFETVAAPAGSGEPKETIRQAFRVSAGTLSVTLQLS